MEKDCHLKSLFNTQSEKNLRHTHAPDVVVPLLDPWYCQCVPGGCCVVDVTTPEDPTTARVSTGAQPQADQH